jgi:uncharacterized membrane protein
MLALHCIVCFFKFRLIVGVQGSIVNALYGLRITDQLSKSYVFTRVVRSQSTLQPSTPTTNYIPTISSDLVLYCKEKNLNSSD